MTTALTFSTSQIHIGQELHFNVLKTFARTGGAKLAGMEAEGTSGL